MSYEIDKKYKISEDQYLDVAGKLAEKYNNRDLLRSLYWIVEGTDPFYSTLIGLERIHCCLSLEYLFKEYLKPDGDWSLSHHLIAKEVEETNLIMAYDALSKRGTVNKIIKTNPKYRGHFAKIKEKAWSVNKERMFLMYRGWFKTTLISVAHSLQELLINPELKLLIISGSLDTAQSILGAIKGHLMFNDRIRFIFPEYCPCAGKTGKIEFGTQDKFVLPNRRTYDSREPSVQAASVGSTLTGLHFFKHKYDDLINEDNVTSDEQIEKAKEMYQLCQNLYENNSQPIRDIIGTHYHSLDLYMDIKRKHADSNGEYESIRFNPVTKVLETIKRRV